ncbi:MAG TPA: NTP transferase domain-containing protein [Armatimonadota bacterium]|nr:NTP transferase domain-containing protein [Armatimonadota bacterium]
MSLRSLHAASFQAVILAAGKGTRMESGRPGRPKVLLLLCGRPILGRVLDVLAEAGITYPVVVVGRHGEKPIKEALGSACRYALQKEQLGSGHAVMCAQVSAGRSKNILVICGDSPLFKAATIRSLMEAHIREHATITLTSAVLEDPSGYGRILRDPAGSVSGIVEEKLATDQQKAVKEVNGGCYAFEADWLWDNIQSMRRNEAGEYCLTEMVDIAVAQDRKVITVPAELEEIAGVNTPSQLREAEAIFERRGDRETG